MKVISLILSVLFLAVTVRAEFRIWEKTDGSVFEGEFVTIAGEFVIINDQAGKEYRAKPDELCARDLEYLEWRVPPQLNLDVSKNTDNAGTQGQTEKVRCTATIKQADTRPYTGELTAVLVIMGETIGTETPMMVNRKEVNFTLPETRGTAFEFISDLAQFSRKSKKAGREYSGYILVIYDRFGEAIAIKSNRAAYEERATKYASLGVSKKLSKGKPGDAK